MSNVLFIANQCMLRNKLSHFIVGTLHILIWVNYFFSSNHIHMSQIRPATNVLGPCAKQTSKIPWFKPITNFRKWQSKQLSGVHLNVGPFYNCKHVKRLKINSIIPFITYKMKKDISIYYMKLVLSGFPWWLRW